MADNGTASGIYSQIYLTGELECDKFVPNIFKKNLCANCSHDVSKHKQESVKESDLIVALEFTQEMEKIPSLILEGDSQNGALFLGGYKAVLNIEFLKSNNIKYILNTAKDLDKFLGPKFVKIIETTNDKLGVVTLHTNWVDNISHVISMKELYDAVMFIEKGRVTTSSVLVHCAQGISRSSTAVIAYVMCKKGMSAEAATKIVKSKRKMANPNSGFVKLLEDFYKSSEFVKCSQELMQTTTTML